jgi:hypothetical protein
MRSLNYQLATLGILAAVAVAGCGKTEESGQVGETLSAEGLEVTVDLVDTAVPVPRNDVTGLSLPRPGTKLVGTLVRACSEHPGAIGPFSFGVRTTSGEEGALKQPQRNYGKSFETVRGDCGDGWIVFEIPAGSDTESITFGFEDTGTASPQSDQEIDAEFTWALG